MATTAQRIYIARIKSADGSIARRLVRASHPSPVVQHVSRSMITVSIPTQDELIACAKAGIEPEDINAQPEQLPLGD